MELIDKQKLLKWLDKQHFNEAWGMIELIQSGTFDDHSTQEEIKELRKRLEVAEEAAEIVSAKADARVIRAEQKRDELLGRLNLALTERDGSRRAAVEYRKENKQLVEERNALLEGLKWYAGSDKWERGEHRWIMALLDKGDRARCIIAKLEGK